MTAFSSFTSARADHTKRRAAAILVGLSGVTLLVAFAPLVGGILSALVLAVALDRPYRRLAARISHSRAAAVMLIACGLLIFLPALAIGHQALQQLGTIELRPEASVGAISSAFGASTGQVRAALDKLASTVSSSLSGIAMSFVGGVASGLLNTLVAFLCLYFLLLSGNTLWAKLRGFLPFSAETSDQLGHDLRRVILSTLLGTLSSAVLQGASVSLGFTLAGLPAAALWGVIAGFVSMIPVVGTALVWVPAAIFLFLEHQTKAMLIIVAFGWLIPTIIDQVVRARVSRRLGHVHPLTTLLGAIVGVRLFGMMGVVAGPLMIALFLELLHQYEREYGTGEREVAGVRDAKPLTAAERV